MKKCCLILFVSVFALTWTSQPAHALKVFMDTFHATYLKENKNADFVKTVTEAKCNLCHYGTSKENRNDFGSALSKLVDKEDYKPSRLKAEAEAAAKEIKDALKKVEEQASVSGAKFGELITSGKMPGTPPKKK